MKSLRLLDRRAGYSLASIGLMLGLVAPTLVPAFASAGQLNERSITMSNSTTTTASSYKLEFTPDTGIGTSGALFIDFCDNSPIIGDTCNVANAPASGSATLGTVDYGGTPPASAGTITATANGIKWVPGTAVPASTVIDVTFNNVTNPATAATAYARMESYDGTTNLPTQHTAANAVGNTSDTGAVALSFTNSIGVTAYVQESMTFCVSGQVMWQNCGQGRSGVQAGAVTAPSLTLGEDTGNGSKALSVSAISTGTVYSQLSTNAASGAVVNLLSNTVGCGGLTLNTPAGACNIVPEATAATSFTAGTAKFGLTVGSSSTATTDGTTAAPNATGSLNATNGYDGTNYFIDYHSGDATGVTSPYGSPIFQSGSSTPAPVSNQNIPLTLGASINNNTPAGKYGATLQLIATGKF